MASSDDSNPIQGAYPDLPGLDCGLCGLPTCADLLSCLRDRPDLLQRCIHLDPARMNAAAPEIGTGAAGSWVSTPARSAAGAGVQGVAAGAGVSGTANAAALGAGAPARPAAVSEGAVSSGPAAGRSLTMPKPRTLVSPEGSGPCAGCGMGPVPERTWVDSLGREFDFILNHFPEEPGPRKVILPHNPMLTREMEIRPGDVMIGRPLGMSCGCPITHCGVVMEVDRKTGVIVWCVTGPLRPRQEGYKDIGYYIAEAYEGLVRASRLEIRIGLRYFFQPEMCMLQWRHSGLVNYVNRLDDGLQVRVEGLWIG